MVTDRPLQGSVAVPAGSLERLAYGAPRLFFPLAGKLAGWCMLIAVALCGVGLYIGFFVAPAERGQGEVFRIVFLHVPAAWMSLFIYVVMSFWAAMSLLPQARMPALMVRALAPTGAMFAFLALGTGALWGKPAWGTWWTWDPRLTAEFSLLCFFLVCIAVQTAMGDTRRADRLSTLVALAGLFNIPVIYASLRWWLIVHQGPSFAELGVRGSIGWVPVGILLMTLGFWAYSIAAAMVRVRCLILLQERHAAWAIDYAKEAQ